MAHVSCGTLERRPKALPQTHKDDSDSKIPCVDITVPQNERKSR